MKKFTYILFGFFGFIVASSICSFLAILVYSKISDKTSILVSFILMVVVIFSASILAILDFFRRKIMIDKPLKEILDATERFTKGDFSIRLSSSHSYEYRDEFDLIKENLNNMSNELSKNEVLKNNFIANVSHEIKTPLSVIQSYANALKNETLPKDMRNKYLDNLQDSCKKLNSLVTNILKLNKLENQRLLPEFTNFNLSELLANQIVNFEELIEKKAIELECDIEEDLIIKSEESYLELVFNNLMSNALKFTDYKGKIDISLKKINDEYIIKFKDNGCGMDSETGAHIFDKFYQGDSSHSKEGNGLGLSLVKKVIDIIGGSISVESELNVGTTFTIIIKGE